MLAAIREWIERRTLLTPAWRAPILLIQGARSHAQPVGFKLIDARHFWPVENPDETSAAIETFLTGTPPFGAAAWLES